METWRIETVVAPNRILTIRGVPFREGEKVEVIVQSHTRKQNEAGQYPLRGKRIRYAAPFDSVGEKDWNALK